MNNLFVRRASKKITERQLDAALRAQRIAERLPATTDCPPLPALALLASDRLERNDARRVREHIFSCDRCAILYREAAEFMQEEAIKTSRSGFPSRIVHSGIAVRLHDLMREGHLRLRSDGARSSRVPLVIAAACALLLCVLFQDKLSFLSFLWAHRVYPSQELIVHRSDDKPLDPAQDRKPKSGTSSVAVVPSPPAPRHSESTTTGGGLDDAGSGKRGKTADKKDKGSGGPGIEARHLFATGGNPENGRTTPGPRRMPERKEVNVSKRPLVASGEKAPGKNRTTVLEYTPFVKPKELDGTNPMWQWEEHQAGGEGSRDNTADYPQDLVQISPRATRVRASTTLPFSWTVPNKLVESVRTNILQTTIILNGDDGSKQAIVVPAEMVVPDSKGIATYPYSIAKCVKPGHSYRWKVNMVQVSEDEEQKTFVALSKQDAFFEVIDSASSQRIEKRLAATGGDRIATARILVQSLELDEAESVLREIPSDSALFKAAQRHLGEIAHWRGKSVRTDNEVIDNSNVGLGR